MNNNDINCELQKLVRLQHLLTKRLPKPKWKNLVKNSTFAPLNYGEVAQMVRAQDS